MLCREKFTTIELVVRGGNLLYVIIMQLNQTRYISFALLIFFGTLVLSFSSFALTIGVVHDNVTERYNFFDIEHPIRRPSAIG